MPIIKSARKRVKIAAKANLRNAKTKRVLRDSLKAFSKAITGGTAAEVVKAQKAAMSALDQAVKKDVIHKNKAARKKAQLSAAAKTKGIKPAKTTVKKTAPKTAVSKKPAVKTRKTTASTTKKATKK